MMTTALLVFLGLSTCATLCIVAALAVNGRASLMLAEAGDYDADEEMTTAPVGQSASAMPVFGH